MFGFIPAGKWEVVEGDPENPPPPNSLMELKPTVVIHEVKDHPEKSGELLYVQRTRLIHSKKKGHHDDSLRIVASSRAELWSLAKEQASIAAAAAK